MDDDLRQRRRIRREAGAQGGDVGQSDRHEIGGELLCEICFAAAVMGECQKIDWTFLGLSMPGWVFLCVLALTVWGLWANLSRRGAVQASQ